jgi:hypothetical protein
MDDTSSESESQHSDMDICSTNEDMAGRLPTTENIAGGLPVVDLAFINENYYDYAGTDSTPRPAAWSPEHRLCFELTDANTRQALQNVRSESLLDLDALKGLVELDQLGLACTKDLLLVQRLRNTRTVFRETKTKVIRRTVRRNSSATFRPMALSTCPNIQIGAVDIPWIGLAKIFLVFPDVYLPNKTSVLNNAMFNALQDAYVAAFKLDCGQDHEHCQMSSMSKAKLSAFKSSFPLTTEATKHMQYNYLKTIPKEVVSCFCRCLEDGLNEAYPFFGKPWIYLHSVGSKHSSVTDSIQHIEQMGNDIAATFQTSRFLSLDVDVALRQWNFADGAHVTTVMKRSAIRQLDSGLCKGSIYQQGLTHDLVHFQSGCSRFAYKSRIAQRGAFHFVNFYCSLHQQLAPEGVRPLQNLSDLASVFIFRPLLPALQNIWGRPLLQMDSALQTFDVEVAKVFCRLDESKQHDIPFR